MNTEINTNVNDLEVGDFCYQEGHVTKISKNKKSTSVVFSGIPNHVAKGFREAHRERCTPTRTFLVFSDKKVVLPVNS